mmetsp:Transcript_8929/g.10435  ORF Transcript_8929/g.10435 Transcript_8929/m.10435 type:complete len:530 (+) Transcript_8929:64-1653(+)
MTSETLSSRRGSPLPINTAQQGGIHIHETIPTTTTIANIDDGMVDHSEDIRILPPPPRYSRVWKALILSVAIGLVSGSLYGFGRYSRDLRDTLKLTQSQVQRFGILLDTGNYLGHPVTGWVYDKLGSRLSCLLAAVIVFISYGSIHLGLWTTLPLWIVNVGFFGVGFGSGLSYLVGLGRVSKDFHGTSVLGRVVGLVSSSYGLSSTLVGITYHRFGLEKFFLFWAFLVAFVNLIGAFIFSDQLEGSISETEVHHIEDAEDERQNNVAPANDYFNTQIIPTDYVRINEHIDDRLLLSTTTLTSDRATRIASGIETPNEAMQWVSWRRLDFWLLFLSFGCITGSGLFIINNISTIVQSIGGEDAMAGRLVIFLSMCSVFGRLFMGQLADHPKLCKLDLLRYLSLIMALGLFIGCIAGVSTLWLTVAMVAMPYGGSWVLIVGILSEFYGNSNFGKDYGLIVMGPAISGFVFNTVSAWLYEYNADKDSGICTGKVCYRNSYLITGIAALVGSLIISRISKPIYQRNLDDCSND